MYLALFAIDLDSTRHVTLEEAVATALAVPYDFIDLVTHDYATIPQQTLANPA